MQLVIKSLLMLSLGLISISSFALANPASTHCVNAGNKLIMIQNTGICIFPDGSYCEEWSYFRGKCKSGQNQFPGGKYNAAQKQQYCISKINNMTIVEMCLQQSSSKKDNKKLSHLK